MFIATAALLLTATTALPAQAKMAGMSSAASNISTSNQFIHKAGRRGRHIAAGVVIGLGVLGAIAASNAHAQGHYYETRFERRCRRWHRRCVHGSDRACYKFDTRC